MKWISTCAFFLIFISYGSNGLSAQDSETAVVFAEGGSYAISFPMSVAQLIEQKCYGCHAPGGRNDKAKDKLMWNTLHQMDAMEAVSILEEIHEVVQEGAMPPEKIVQKYPDMKLTEEEKAILKDWVEGLQQTLMHE